MDKAFISGYKIIRQVGEGGMAVVYLAQHRDVPDHKVIMKELKDPNLAARFLKEANHLARLDHPRICPIFHFFTEDNRTFILMKYVEGETLKETLDRRGALSIPESLRITADLLDALSYAHKKKIYHRDIKPSNIMIDSEGNTMVIDFGIAKSEEDPDMTQEGSFCGTPHFAPPEQFYSASTIDWALADIYALGVTLFLLVTGEFPFPGQNWMEIAESKRSTNPPKPSAKNKNVPAQFDRLVLSALSRDPRKRFQSAADMLSALVEVQKEIPSSTAEDLEYTRTIVSHSQSLAKPRRKLLWPSLAAAAVVTALVIWQWPDLTGFSGEPNMAPTISDLGPYTVAAESALSFLVVASDPDSDPLSLNASGLPAGAAFVDHGDNTGSFTWVPDSNQVGLHNLSILVSDGQDSASDDIMIVVQGADVTGANGIIELSVTPSADVYLDDSLIAKNVRGAVTFAAAVGRRVVKMRNAEAAVPEWIDTVLVQKNQTTKANHNFVIQRPAAKQTGVISLSVTPEGDLYIDGKLIGRAKSSFSETLDVGQHLIKLENSGAKTPALFDTIIITGNESLNRSYTFDMIPELGSLTIGSAPMGARIYINGELQSEKAPFTFSLPPGSYRVRVETQDQSRRKDTIVEVTAGELQRFIAKFGP